MRTADALRLFLTLCLSSTLQCGPPAPTLSHGLSDRTIARLAQAPAVYAPPVAAAARTGETDAMAATFEGSLEPQARARLRHDPALDLVAAALAENFSDQGQGMSTPFVQWLMWRSGSVAIHRDHSGGYASRRGRGRTLLEGSTTRAAEMLNAAPDNTLSYGLARFTEGRLVAEMVVLGAAPFDVAPFSKTYAPGGPITLSLRPRSPIREVLLSIGADEAIEEHLLTPRPDGSFFFAGPVPVRPGRYLVEVEGPPPRRTLMLVPIYVAVPEPTKPDDFIQSPPAGPADLSGWPAWLASTYNAERARVGKPPLELDTRLSLLAGSRSLAASDGRRLPPTDSDAFIASLKATGIPPGAFHESVTTVAGTDSILMNLLRPSVRRRLVLGNRVLFGASASPRPVKPDSPQTYSVAEETVIAAPLPPPAPPPAPPPPP